MLKSDLSCHSNVVYGEGQRGLVSDSLRSTGKSDSVGGIVCIKSDIIYTSFILFLGIKPE